MSDSEKVKGPASYFPSVEKEYGPPVAHWKALFRGRAVLAEGAVK